MGLKPIFGGSQPRAPGPAIRRLSGFTGQIIQGVCKKCTWCGILTDPDGAFAGCFGCILLGRNKNRWDEPYDPEWQDPNQ